MDFKNASVNITLHEHFLEEQFLESWFFFFLRFYLTIKKIKYVCKR